MEPDHHLADNLQAGLAKLGLDADTARQEKLLAYLALLVKWNAAYNLSGIQNPDQMVAYHLLDSLALVPHITGDTILDVGSGAGLPGIPLAIWLPRKRFLLLDSNGKKVRFLFQVKTELGLENVSVVHQRVENFQSREQIDIVLCRAFAALDKFVHMCGPLAVPNGKLLAMKRHYPEAEVGALPAGYTVSAVTEMTVPGVEGPRHLLEIGPAGGH